MAGTRRASRKTVSKRPPAQHPALLPADQSYLQRILNAKVYEVAQETSLDAARNLSKRIGNKVWLKREDQQPVFSFKLRGAYNKMANLAPGQLARGVICASAGNHAQGVALSAKKLGCRAVTSTAGANAGESIDLKRVDHFGERLNAVGRHGDEDQLVADA